MRIQILANLIFAVLDKGFSWKLAVIKWSSAKQALTERWNQTIPITNETELNGEKMLVETDVIYPYALAYSVNGKLIISGFTGEIWSILEEKLNFTSEFRLLDRDFEISETNVTLVLTNAYPSSFNFRRGTVPLTTIWFHLYTKRVPLGGGLLLNNSFKFNSLELNSRDILLALTVTFSILDWILKKTILRMTTGRKKNLEKKGCLFSESIINCLGLLFSQGAQCQFLNTSHRIFNLTVMAFTLVVSTAFSATLTSKLAGASNLKLDVMSRLVSTGDFTLCSSEIGMVSSIINELRFQSIPSFPKEWLKNVNRAPCTSHKLEYVPPSDYCLDKTIALEVFQVSNARWAMNPGRCNVFRLPIKLFSTSLALNVAEDFRYLEILNRYLLKFKEFGIVSRLEQKWLPKDPIDYPPDDVGVSFVVVRSFVEILGGGMAVSLLAIILEYLHYGVVQLEERLLNDCANERRKKIKREKPPYAFVY